MDWHSISTSLAAEKTGCDIKRGLSEATARARLEKEGQNTLIREKKHSLIKRFISQFSDVSVLTLLAACAVSFITGITQENGDLVDPIIILVIVILNAVIGVYQENRAEKSIEALRKMSAPSAGVIRAGKFKKYRAKKLYAEIYLSLKAATLCPPTQDLSKKTDFVLRKAR